MAKCSGPEINLEGQGFVWDQGLPKAYIAASFPRREDARALKSCLESVVYCNSRWLQDEHTTYGGGEDQRFAEQDLQDVVDADVLIVLTDGKKQLTRGGRHAEFGIALALKKPIFLLGPREQIFHHHPRVIHIEDSWTTLPNWRMMIQCLYLAKSAGAVV